MLVISDANVLIDIEIGALTSYIFNLPFEVAVPDVLYEQELSARHSHLLNLGLKIKEVKGEYIQKVVELSLCHRNVSRMDLVALALAMQENCTLLTGDKNLRSVAKSQNVEIHGTVWLVEQILNKKLIQPIDAEKAYRQMRESGSRLPWPIAFRELEKYKV
jgi:predicted nucleic acid-binding protein